MRRCNGVSKLIYKSEMSRMDVKMMTSGMENISSHFSAFVKVTVLLLLGFNQHIVHHLSSYIYIMFLNS